MRLKEEEGTRFFLVYFLFISVGFPSLSGSPSNTSCSLRQCQFLSEESEFNFRLSQHSQNQPQPKEQPLLRGRVPPPPGLSSELETPAPERNIPTQSPETQPTCPFSKCLTFRKSLCSLPPLPPALEGITASRRHYFHC